ncbi:MAG: hypothetical protein AAFR67_08425 [Chloroflexota bacterium]
MKALETRGVGRPSTYRTACDAVSGHAFRVDHVL